VISETGKSSELSNFTTQITYFLLLEKIVSVSHC
jgi:hypothetical protein